MIANNNRLFKVYNLDGIKKYLVFVKRPENAVLIFYLQANETLRYKLDE